jgi:hypothetical protein
MELNMNNQQDNLPPFPDASCMYIPPESFSSWEVESVYIWNWLRACEQQLIDYGHQPQDAYRFAANRATEFFNLTVRK